MAARGRRSGAGIRGPQSALTDFLASHNISAQQINLDYQNRIAQQQADQAATEAAAQAEEAAANQTDEEEDAAERKKRKRKEEKAIAKIKASKGFKKRKFEHQRDNPDEDSDGDALAREMLKKPSKAPPKPGQFSNCEICEKRFTVTPYTIAGPDGGLVCMKCGKELKHSQKKADNAAKKETTTKRAPRGRKRQTESDRLMGDIRPGAKSLIEHCVRKVADVVNDIEDFGDLPQNLLDRLSQILSKQRVLTSRTLQLFLQPGIDRIAVYDCAKLETEDFQKIFAFMPDVERVNLRMAGQFKDESLQYMIEKNSKITHLQLGATNLISDAAWKDLFLSRGAQLESLKLSELNDAMKDETIQVMAETCTNLKRLKLRTCLHMTEASINAISNITTLEHLSLSVAKECSPEALTSLVANVGAGLKTLSLEDYYYADDTLLETIKATCKNLSKLRLTGSSSFTDATLANLFTNWDNAPIPIIDLNSNRDLEDVSLTADEPTPEDDMIGFGSKALKAMFAHSGNKLMKLDLHSCRHIGREALHEVFDPESEKQYPNLREMDLSFVTDIDEFAMGGLFKTCPDLAKLTVFACFSVKEARIPQGVAVIGLPKAQAGVTTMGDA